ncbi:hypothetical protein [Streptomyces sp. MZ04]|uniref:hypothetical protein n=1 Tax=Streptomyces sp. MZ04 TaxID=2559236 RepID=UPI0014331BC6|nr:hypothetical protein [Streptomyces sp. MZ04]
MTRLLRGIVWIAVPFELAFVTVLLGGAALPGTVLVGAEALAVALLVVAGAGLAVLHGRGGPDAVRDVVPEPVRRIVGHELRALVSLFLWVARVRGERRSAHEPADDVLDLVVASQASLTLELREPITAVGFLGKRRPVTTVRLHADDPAGLLAALKAATRETATAE